MTVTTLTVREAIDRDLGQKPQEVIVVAQTGQLRTDLTEYVLTDALVREFARVLEPVVDSARPAGGETDRVGIWVSGFFGSGKSHFSKLVGHLLANTTVEGDTARELFARLLHAGPQSDERIRELFQEAANYQLACHLVPFDITALHSDAAETNVGLTFLRALYESVGLSRVPSFAECEFELRSAGLDDQLVVLYQQKCSKSWAEDKHVAALATGVFAECLAELLPHRYASPEAARHSLQLGMAQDAGLNIDEAVDRLLRWLDAEQQRVGRSPLRLMFVADEVGAWAGRNLDRIEQVRSFVETLGRKGRGRLWLLATSQEKLSSVVQNAPTGGGQQERELLQRLEARFQTNVHLESSEVGAILEERILRKKPHAVPALEGLWTSHEEQLRDVAESPGLELGANYPRPERDAFVKDYPFLPYQLAAAADIFGNMRGMKVSSGARSMLGVAFDATRALADQELGAVVSWDQIFDSANRDNEFADEQYLGSQGLTYLGTADRDVTDAPLHPPSRLLKTLWLVQHTERIPRTPRNLARLLVDDLDVDVLQLERDVETTLDALEAKHFVRRDITTGHWKFLTQEQVTVEKIVRRIATDDIRATEVREQALELYKKELLAQYSGRVQVGRSNTTFEYGIYLNNTPLKNDSATVQLRVSLKASPAAGRVAEESASYLESPTVHWVVGDVPKLDERVRRYLAIERIPQDEEYRRLATDRTRLEVQNMQVEAADLRGNAERDVRRAMQSGVLHWQGKAVPLPPPSGSGQGAAKARIDEALKDRVQVAYFRFAEGDRVFNAMNIDRLFAAPPGERAALDPDLGLFSPDGHVHSGQVVVEELVRYLQTSPKTAGKDVVERFEGLPFGWPPDLLRYAAAAMFVDTKLSIVDPAGKRHDDPRVPAARGLFGTNPFKTARLTIEEEGLTPAESTRARDLLGELGFPPAEGNEIALKDAALQLCVDLGKRLGLVERAREVELPLPPVYEGIDPMLEEITGSGSRVKIVRALLAHGDELRSGQGALRRLAEIDAQHGFAQYRRSQQLLHSAIQAGLAEDPVAGAAISRARDELEALRDQKRVLDEWEVGFKKYRGDVVDVVRAAYAPLREGLARRVAAARAEITSMPEYDGLTFVDKATVRTEFLHDGRPLAEVSMPELRDEQELLGASSELSLGHMRSTMAALDAQIGAAKARVIELYTADQERKGEEGKFAAWRPAAAFAGKQFATEAEVDDVFDAEKERVKALVREGKTVRVV